MFYGCKILKHPHDQVLDKFYANENKNSRPVPHTVWTQKNEIIDGLKLIFVAIVSENICLWWFLKKINGISIPLVGVCY